MSIKINDATSNRPEGHRLIDAPAVQVNFTDFVKQLKEEKAWETSDRNAITVFKTQGVTVVITALHKGASLTDLQVDGLLMLQLMEGTVTVYHEGATVKLNNLEMLILHAATASCITADQECVLQLSYIKTIPKPQESII